MVDQIERLMEEIRREEEAKNSERLKVLSMQISPHFVYNTLNTIKWMATANRQENICRMIESLIKMMVSVTYHTNEEITGRNSALRAGYSGCRMYSAIVPLCLRS